MKLHSLALSLSLATGICASNPLVAAEAVPAATAPVASQTAAARGVLSRLLGERATGIELAMIPKAGLTDVAEITCADGRLVVKGSSPVALCHGFYEYLRVQGLGMVSWSGSRLAIPARWPDQALLRVATPYQHRYYFNVVTYGYTMPYWTWDRWQQEIDWMALHGIDMPLALVANEAIGDRVWKKLGLAQPEIDEFYTGPAHLPWQRMGNITRHDGPLSASWHADQVAMQHQILARMRELGIKPIVPAFAGFVPKAMKRLHPEIELHMLRWGGFPESKQAYLLSPHAPLFQEIGKTFIQEWEKEFGKCQYYLADSFNEMELPKTDRPVTDLLADYGDAIYRSIQAGNPEAIWVVQGWMFGFQRHIWNQANTKALLSKVPNDRMFILDEALDYNGTWWRNGMNYDFYDGFYGKPWGLGYIPNMGGKSGWTGYFSFYAKCPADALNSPKKGNLIGYGLCPEGIENNEMLYELLTDMAWRTTPAELDAWTEAACKARYGSYSPAIRDAWTSFRKSCYNSFTDHPRFGWQTMGTSGSVHDSPEFRAGVEKFLSAADELKQEPLYRNDAIELAAAYLGHVANEWFALALNAHNNDQAELRDRAVVEGLARLTELDRLLESHPTLNLKRWLGWARRHGATPAETDGYEANARRLITVWGPPINDYSARMWSGLVRDFYRDRMAQYFAALKENRPFNRSAWEEAWVQAKGVSAIAPYPDPVAAARELVQKAQAAKIPVIPPVSGTEIGRWARNQYKTEWQTVEWRISTEQARNCTGVIFKYAAGGQRLNMKDVILVADGKDVSRDNHFGFTGVPDKDNRYRVSLPKDATCNNDAVIRATICTDGGTDSQGAVFLIERGTRH